MASVEELEELEVELRSSKGAPSCDNLSKFMKLVRELRIRDSPSVKLYGGLLLDNFRNSLSEEELWLVHEQVAVAALDCGATQTAAGLIRAIARKFPTSSRTRRLQGMYWEAQDNCEQAERIYKEVLAEEPGNEVMAKRLVALEKSRGNLSAAVEALRKYLEVWANDQSAWEELAELYLEMLMYRQAAFCYEELMMLAPGSVNHMIRYADVLYTLGGAANMRVARAYYARAVEVSGGRSLRGLYGVLACSANNVDKVTLQDARSRAQLELPELSAQALVRLYKQSAQEKLVCLDPYVRGLSDSQTT